jgi:ABC-2 type transport system permease protein
VSASLVSQVGVLARRSIARTLRQPILFLPNLLFPLFMLAVVSGTADRATAIKGFPTDSYVTFLIGAMMVQAGAGATTIAGNGLGSDIESGFFSRLALTPMRASALIAAQLAGVAVLGIIQAVLILVTGLIAGVSIEAGVAGGIALIAFILLVILAFGSLGLMVAVRTGSGEQVQALFSITLALLFLSSMAMPRNLMKEDWFQTVATYNPMSYLIEAARSFVLSGWDGEALALGGGIAGALLVFALGIAVSGLRKRSLAR